MLQKMLTEGKLLSKTGELNESGYSFSLIKEYRRKDIKGLKTRIKEWDYYYVGNHDYALALTIDDNSYMSLGSITFLDFKNKTYLEKSTMHPFSFGKVKLSETSKVGNVSYKDKNFDLHFDNDSHIRHIYGKVKNLEKNKDINFDFTLSETTNKSMVIATPFFKKKHFYYNQKINNLKAKGSFEYDKKIYSLDNCYGVLDWGRGVWTRKNTWYWSSLNDVSEGHTIGFNLGYGFGDTSSASENMLFYDDKAYKLEDVEFKIKQNEKGEDLFLDEWWLTNKDGSINLTFKPLILRRGGANALIIKSIQNQVFGLFTGYIIVGHKRIEITNLIGFCEKVYNCW